MWQHSEFHKSRLGLGLRLLDASREGVQDFERLLKTKPTGLKMIRFGVEGNVGT